MKQRRNIIPKALGREFGKVRRGGWLYRNFVKTFRLSLEEGGRRMSALRRTKGSWVRGRGVLKLPASLSERALNFLRLNRNSTVAIVVWCFLSLLPSAWDAKSQRRASRQIYARSRR